MSPGALRSRRGVATREQRVRYRMRREENDLYPLLVRQEHATGAEPIELWELSRTAPSPSAAAADPTPKRRRKYSLIPRSDSRPARTRGRRFRLHGAGGSRDRTASRARRGRDIGRPPGTPRAGRESDRRLPRRPSHAAEPPRTRLPASSPLASAPAARAARTRDPAGLRGWRASPPDRPPGARSRRRGGRARSRG